MWKNICKAVVDNDSSTPHWSMRVEHVGHTLETQKNNNKGNTDVSTHKHYTRVFGWLVKDAAYENWAD